MDFKEIRKLVIIALFSDDELMEKFVLKGGNALDIIYQIGTRSSLDLDVSISDDFDDVEDAKERIFRSLKDRFDAAGYVVFDESFQKRPSRIRAGLSPRWGGYEVEFKLTPRGTFEQYKNDLAYLQRSALAIGPDQQRKFTIDISKFEFCEPKVEIELDNFTIYVYSLPMIAIEKLRAICQQLPGYPLRSHPRPRARDFYDIHTVVTNGGFDIVSAENLAMLQHIFEAKEVPLALLAEIESSRTYHVTDWPDVLQSISGKAESFDFYFDYVVEIVRRLQASGIV